MSGRRGKVQTVLGMIDPIELGTTMMHEHLFVDSSAYWEEPSDLRSRELAGKPVSMENLGWVRINPFRSLDNMILADEKVLIRELLEFKALGGSTIVDVTPRDVGRDAPGLQRLSRLTGVNVVCGTAYYQSLTHPEDMTKKTLSELKNEFVREVTRGIGATGARAGIIGEVGNGVLWHENERKCCAAAVGAQLETGAAISIHPGQSRDSPFEILRFLKKEGADISRVIMGHADTRLSEPEDFEELAKTGCFVELDTFGFDRFHFGSSPSDKQRIRTVAWMIEHGLRERILISQDVCLKSSLVSYGGYGYGHVLQNIIPALREVGVSGDDFCQILVRNPADALTFH